MATVRINPNSTISVSLQTVPANTAAHLIMTGTPDFIWSSSAAAIDTVGFEVPTIPEGSTINSVKIYSNIYYTVNRPCWLVCLGYLSDSFYPATDGFHYYNFEWTINPATSSAFVVSDFDSFNGGIRLEGESPGTALSTILYAEINYTTPLTFVPKVIM